jgi:hypothetical protein
MNRIIEMNGCLSLDTLSIYIIKCLTHINYIISKQVDK